MESSPERRHDQALVIYDPQSLLKENLLRAISPLNIGEHLYIYVPSAHPEVSQEERLVK
jgi:hypothetical protein